MAGQTEEQTECPLCMEPLEIDDINFYPCTCGYQICRFCWHRIRTDENGLCPACRKAYPEDPAKFNPLTDDELQRIKKERRQKDLQRKQKAAENRKHLANVRVVQRNLVFVVGLSQRLADPEVLKKQEYFGKFGKIHKVVINQSTSYAGAQGPSASAYVTYNKPDDALKAILAVNNVHADGRTLKASLGTTKYCSHFLRGTQCPKTDCMYLHELGEEAASFTKEEMQVGKHQEYEQKLLEQYINSQNTAHTNHTNNRLTTANSRKKASSPTNVIQQPSPSPPQTQTPSPPQRQNIHTTQPQTQIPNTTNKDAWPSLQQSGSRPDRPVPTTTTQTNTQTHTDRQTDKLKTDHNRAPGKHRISETEITHNNTDTYNGIATEPPVPTANNTSPRQHSAQSLINSLGNKRKSLGLDTQDNLSLFSSINGYHGNRNSKPLVVQTTEVTDIPSTEIPDTIPVKSTTDWQAAFGFGQSTAIDTDWQDDDLGFDPLEESSRGLADLIEKENGQRQQQQQQHNSMSSHMFNGLPTHTRSLQNNIGGNIPPGFSHSHIHSQSSSTFPLGTQSSSSSQSRNFIPSETDVLSSRMSGYVNNPPLQNSYSMFTDLPYLPQTNNTHQNDVFNMKDLQDGLRALLPNINISFGSQQLNNVDTRTNTQLNSTQKNWIRHNVETTSESTWMTCADPAILTSSTFTSDWIRHNVETTSESTWMTCADPAILTSSTFTSDAGLHDTHWLKSFNPLTDIDTNNHRLPFVQQFPVRTILKKKKKLKTTLDSFLKDVQWIKTADTVWPPQTHNPPPGFQTHMRPPLQTADKLAEGLQ